MIGFDELIEIHRQEFKWNDQVPSKNIIIENPHNVIFILFVTVIQHLQNLQLHTGLMLKSFFISDDFDSHQLLQLVVVALNSLAKRARA